MIYTRIYVFVFVFITCAWCGSLTRRIYYATNSHIYIYTRIHFYTPHTLYTHIRIQCIYYTHTHNNIIHTQLHVILVRASKCSIYIIHHLYMKPTRGRERCRTSPMTAFQIRFASACNYIVYTFGRGPRSDGGGAVVRRGVVHLVLHYSWWSLVKVIFALFFSAHGPSTHRRETPRPLGNRSIIIIIYVHRYMRFLRPSPPPVPSQPRSHTLTRHTHRNIHYTRTYIYVSISICTHIYTSAATATANVSTCSSSLHKTYFDDDKTDNRVQTANISFCADFHSNT